MRIKNLKLVFDTVNGEDKLIMVRSINNFEDFILRRDPSEYIYFFHLKIKKEIFLKRN